MELAWQITAEVGHRLAPVADGLERFALADPTAVFAAAALVLAAVSAASRQATPALATAILASASCVLAFRNEIAWSALATGAASVGALAGWRERRRSRQLQTLARKLDELDDRMAAFLDGLDKRSHALELFGREGSGVARTLNIHAAAGAPNADGAANPH